LCSFRKPPGRIDEGAKEEYRLSGPLSHRRNQKKPIHHAAVMRAISKIKPMTTHLPGSPFMADVLREMLETRFGVKSQNRKIVNAISLREDGRPMLQRLGNVFYWTASGAAVLIAALGVWAPTTFPDYPNGGDLILFTGGGFVIAGLVWLAGLAARYILAG
jgi:hypothetical protein